MRGRYSGWTPDQAIMAPVRRSWIIPANDKALDTPMDYDRPCRILVHPLVGSVVIIDDSVNMAWRVIDLPFFQS